MENILSLFRKRGADTSNQESPITLHLGSSNEDDLRVVNIQKLFHTIEKEQPEQDIIVEIDACLKKGTDVNSHNDARNTVLDIAEQKNYQKIVEFLVERGAVRGDSALSSKQYGAGTVDLTSGGDTPHPPGVSSNVFVPELCCDMSLEELLVDNKLQMGHANYIGLLEEVAKDSRYINDKLNLDPYPSANTLALLALKVYSDNPGDKIPPELPQGWELLTTASNFARTNGYFGAAFWCRGQQQVVVAHRGTAITNTGAMLTNYKSIIYEKYSPHMQSAITFTDLIASALREMKKRHGVCFQLSITGHSLGGWLGQVTAFTVKYLQRYTMKDKITFKKVRNIRDGFHAHTVVFDSPGCRPMLSKMKEKFDLRYERSIFFRRLDISSYLSAPNRINSLNMHLGIIFRVVTDLSDVTAWDERTKGYTEKTHSMKKMVQAWSDLESPNMVQMLDWPLRSVLWGEEYNKFFDSANRENEYHQQTHRYEFKEINRNCCTLRTFSEDELLLLDSWMILKKSKMNLTNLIKIKDLTVSDLFDEFVIDKEKQIIECTSEESLVRVIRHTKALMRWVPAEVLAAVKDQAAQMPSIAEAMFRAEGDNFLRSLKQSRLDFRDILGLEAFLTSHKNILYIETPDSDMEMARLVNIFQQINKKWNLPKQANDHYSFMDIRGIKRLQSMVNIKDLFESCFVKDYLFIVQCTDKSFEISLNELLKNLKNNPNNKLIFIDSQDTEFENIVNSFCLSQAIENCLIIKHTEEIDLHDLTKKSIKRLFEQKIIFLQGEHVSLQELVGECCHLTVNQLTQVNNLIGVEMLKRLLTTENYIIKMDVILNHNDLKVHSTLNTEVSPAKIAQVLRHSHDALLVVSGIGREELGAGGWKELVHSMGEESEERIFTSVEDGESTFKKLCREKPDSTAYWLAASAEHISCKAIYEKDLYMVRRFHHIIFNLEQFTRQTSIQDAIFVFLNVTDKKSLVSQCPISEENKHIFLENNHIKTVASDKEADDIIRENPDKTCHILKQVANNGPILWQRSRGPLEGLRPYVTVDRDDSMDERDLCSMNQKLIIIADEPGMGKSTSLTSMSRLLQSAWVIRVELKDCRNRIQNFPSELSLNAVCDFILSEKESMLSRLLQFCLDKQNTHSREVYLLFDGFDEVKEDDNAEDKVLRLLKYLQTETSARIWVTTRLYKREMLENGLSAFARRFEKISECQQRGYLVMFWRSHLLLELDQCGAAEEEKLERCAGYLYNNTKKVLGGEIKKFMGIPLQMRMLAEVFMQRVKDYVKSENPQKDIRNTFDVVSVFELYRDFIRQKYEIYFSDKTGLNEHMSGTLKDSNRAQITEKHRMLGIRTLFPKFAKDYFDDPEDGWGAELCRIGLVQAGGDGNVEFIHRTLAEHFCADLAADWLNGKGRYYGHAPVIDLLLTEILLQDSHKVITIFLNKFVQIKPLSEEAHKFNAQKISDLWFVKQHSVFNQDGQTALHVAVDERNDGIIDILMRGFKCEPVPKGVIAFVAAHNKEGHTALGLAARKGSDRKIIQEMVQRIEKCSYEVILELILATYIRFTFELSEELKLLDDYLGGNDSRKFKKAFIKTKAIIHKDIPHFLIAVAENRIDDIELLFHEMENDTERYYMLMAPDREGFTALYLAARDGGLPLVKYLVDNGANINIISKDGSTALFTAARNGHDVLVEYLVSEGADINILDTDGQTALFCAAANGSLHLVEYLVDKGAEINILDKDGRTVLFNAAHKGHFTLVEYLVGKGADMNILDTDGSTVLFYAASNGSVQTVEFLVNRGADIHIIEKDGCTALFYAATNGSLPLVEYLVDRGADINILAKDGHTALFNAASNAHLTLVEYLVGKGADINIVDRDGRSVLFYAASNGNLPLVEYLVYNGGDIKILEEDGCTALFYAATNGSLPLVEFLVDNGAEINILDKEGRTALSYAAHNGHVIVVEYLVGKGADINILDTDGRTALFYATWNGSLPLVQYFVDREAEINILDKNGRTALFYAAHNGHVTLFEYLVGKGANMNILNKDGCTALFNAAYNGHVTLVEYLAGKGADLNILDSEGRPLLFYAASNGSLSLVEYLVDNGAKFNILAKDGRTALFNAAHNGHVTLVEYLVNIGVDMNILDTDGRTALFHAAGNGSLPLVEYLVDNGADINIRAKDGCTALFYAADEGHLSLVEYLVGKGADIHILDKNGCTPLFYAATNGSLQLLQYLVEEGADINILSKDSHTALFKAVSKGHLTSVEYLVSKGSDMNILDVDGRTALFYAATYGSLPLVKYLVENRADINIISKDGSTALFYAATNGSLSLVEYLVDKGADINILAKNGHTALFNAASEGHLRLVEYLVDKGAKINIIDKDGGTRTLQRSP